MRIDTIKIKLLMAEQEITQSVLADRCEISRQNISQVLARGTCYQLRLISWQKPWAWMSGRSLSCGSGGRV